MTELAFLEQYSGESIEGLLALGTTHRTDSIVMAVHQAIDQKAARIGDERLTSVERVVLVVESLESEVNNGGFRQFFQNLPECAPVIIDFLLQIGGPLTAAIARDAINALRLPRLDEEAIGLCLRSSDARRDAELEECDRRYFVRPESVESRLFEYLVRNQGSVQLP